MSGRRFRIEGYLGGGDAPRGAAPARSRLALPEINPTTAAPARAAPIVRPRSEPPSERRRMQGELQTMKEAIALTKREIAAVQHSAEGGQGMQRVADELDAVAAATERATSTILGAAEDIESAANMLRSGGAQGRSDHVGTILDRVILLYEACNFQDLTGQRIEKVVGTLKFLEGRLDAMIAAWGAQLRLEESAAMQAQDRPGLVNGPALPGDEHVSQTDIDALFA